VLVASEVCAGDAAREKLEAEAREAQRELFSRNFAPYSFIASTCGFRSQMGQFAGGSIDTEG
jgi:hypothetical protein